MDSPFFELCNVTKYFSKVIANKDVSFSIKKGEILALLGENGAGKSTIMKILYGLYKLDEGKIFKNGVQQTISTPKDAMALGITMIQQHFSLVMAHTVTENIILGNAKGKINYKEQEEKVLRLAEKYGFEIDPKALIRNLSVGDQQKVEILKALYQETELLIMDEPTAVLTPQESKKLMQFMKDFAALGNSVIFITHKLKEVMEVADRIIVMRNGKVYGDLNSADTKEQELSFLMIGKELTANRAEIKSVVEESELLALTNVSYSLKGQPLLQNISFSIKKGEVLGVAGVSGNGQQEICEIICGAKLADAGKILLENEDITKTSIRERIEKGIGYVPADRHRDAMVLELSLTENMMLRTSFDKKWLKKGLINRSMLNKVTENAITDYSIKTAGAHALAKSLSGGNQQKVVLAREVENGYRLIIFDQPTRGLDLGAIDNVHKTILAARDEGKSILLISTELSEIFALSDRIAVIYKGVIQGIFDKSELNTEKIGLLMAGCYTENR